MNPQNRTEWVLEDVKVNVKIKLAALWVVMMFLYAYVDIIQYLQPGHLQKIMTGEMDGTKFTQELLVGSILWITVPSIMIFLSLILKPAVNRWANIIVGIAYIALTAVFVPGNWAYYILGSCVEIAALILIIAYAWKWPKREAGT